MDPFGDQNVDGQPDQNDPGMDPYSGHTSREDYDMNYDPDYVQDGYYRGGAGRPERWYRGPRGARRPRRSSSAPPPTYPQDHDYYLDDDLYDETYGYGEPYGPRMRPRNRPPAWRQFPSAGGYRRPPPGGILGRPSYMPQQYWRGAPGMPGFGNRMGGPAMGNPGYGWGMPPPPPPPGGYNGPNAFGRLRVPNNYTSIDPGLLGLADLIRNSNGGVGGAYPGFLDDPGMDLILGQQRARGKREVDKVALVNHRMRQIDMLRQNQWRDMNDINSQNILKQKLIDNEEDLNLRVALSNRTERMRLNQNDPARSYHSTSGHEPGGNPWRYSSYPGPQHSHNDSSSHDADKAKQADQKAIEGSQPSTDKKALEDIPLSNDPTKDKNPMYEKRKQEGLI